MLLSGSVDNNCKQSPSKSTASLEGEKEEEIVKLGTLFGFLIFFLSILINVWNYITNRH